MSPAFSNGTSWEIWSYNWCDRCLRDAPFRNGISDVGCPIILKAMMDDEVPVEWIRQGEEWSQDYHCIMFKGPGDGGGGEPRPRPEPRGQDGLFPRPERGVRMLLPIEPVRHEVSA